MENKNIWLLPTDKPSRLHITGGLGLYPNGLCPKSQGLCKNQHIYITDNSEIKSGDWFFNPDLNEIFKAEYTPHKNCKKIILTTDQDLIKYGVQAIDDTFLEWFVKNPSCDVVEINKKENLWFCCGFFEEGEENYCINSMPRCPKCNTALGGNPDWTNYEIIIPKEETLGYICPQTKKQCDDECCASAENCHIESSIGFLSEPKQETIKSVTHCPTCGGECSIMVNEDKSHSYKSKK